MMSANGKVKQHGGFGLEIQTCMLDFGQLESDICGLGVLHGN